MVYVPSVRPQLDLLRSLDLSNDLSCWSTSLKLGLSLPKSPRLPLLTLRKRRRSLELNRPPFHGYMTKSACQFLSTRIEVCQSLGYSLSSARMIALARGGIVVRKLLDRGLATCWFDYLVFRVA